MAITLLSVIIPFSGYCQDSSSFSGNFIGKSNFGLDYLHVASYRKERPIYFFNQSFELHLHKKFSSGIGFGLEIFPLALATPVFINSKIHFNIKKTECYVEQSIGKNIGLFPYGFTSNRYIGALGINVKLNKTLFLSAQVGYLFLWDKYGGGEFSTLSALGIVYKIKSVKL